jgi:cytoskeletal protein CcmA (bactofilin family)
MALKLDHTDISSKGTNELNFLGEGTFVEGTIEAKGSIRIDGRVKGAVRAGDTLTIGAKGEVSGEIHARMAVVGGKIDGDINVSEKLVLEANSELIGNLKAKKLVIDDGALFQGKSNMGAPSIRKTSEQPINLLSKGEKKGGPDISEKE